MTRRGRQVLGAAFVLSFGCALALASCSDTPSCEQVCERQEGCADASPDCVAGCLEGEQRADDAGCPERHDELNRCLDGAADICTAAIAECQEETGAFFACTCPDGACLDTSACAYAATTGVSDGVCTVLGVCGDATLSLACNGPDEPCSCLDDAGDEASTVPYDPTFCSDDVSAQGDAAAAACGW